MKWQKLRNRKGELLEQMGVLFFMKEEGGFLFAIFLDLP